VQSLSFLSLDDSDQEKKVKKSKKKFGGLKKGYIFVPLNKNILLIIKLFKKWEDSLKFRN
jgi:hypothetical protein